MPTFRKQRIIGRVIKTLLLLFVFAVNAILLWRVFFSTIPPKTVDSLLPNEALSAAYAQHGEDLIMRYQDQASITRAENNYGYFSVTQCVFIPQANQVQIVVRYNNSTLRHLKEDYALEAMPDREERLFDVTLVKTTDKTPDNTEDNILPEALVTERFFPDGEPVGDTTALYTYYRYVFQNVTVDDFTVGVFADIYYVEDVNYEPRAYGTLCLYDDQTEWLTYSPSRADLEALVPPKNER